MQGLCQTHQSLEKVNLKNKLDDCLVGYYFWLECRVIKPSKKAKARWPGWLKIVPQWAAWRLVSLGTMNFWGEKNIAS